MPNERDEQMPCWAISCWVCQKVLVDCWILQGPPKVRHWVYSIRNGRLMFLVLIPHLWVNQRWITEKRLRFHPVKYGFFLPSLLCGVGCVELCVWPHVNTQFLNLRPWRYQFLFSFFVLLPFRTSFFDDYRFYDIPFVGFLRHSTILKEVFGWNMYPH